MGFPGAGEDGAIVDPAELRPGEVHPGRLLFERMRFQGFLSGHGRRIPIGFHVLVDDLGILKIELDLIPFSNEAMAIRVDDPPGVPVTPIELEGTSETGRVFRTQSFYFTKFSTNIFHDKDGTIDYQGECSHGDLEIPRSVNGHPNDDTRRWLVRQFRTFTRLAHETPLGLVVIGGPAQQHRDAQEVRGFLAIRRPQENTSDTWWEDSHELLSHVARVLSFACDTNLDPMVEQCYFADRVTIRVTRRGRAAAPYMPPFHQLNMQPIFANACESYFRCRERIKQYDAAIRWLTADPGYGELRLIANMSALECILDRCGIDNLNTFIGASPFRGIARKVRSLMDTLNVPDGMAAKIPELNRRNISEKIITLLGHLKIQVADLPKDWLQQVIKQRNSIIHTGVSLDFDDRGPHTLKQIIWTREIIVRIILQELEFQGAYQSWLHHNRQLHFPECIPIEEWVNRQKEKII